MRTPMIAAVIALAAFGPIVHPVMAAPETIVAAVAVSGADVSLTAQWNEAKDAVGIYQAPDGYQIISARPVIVSANRADSSVEVSADRRIARLNVHVRGKGEFWNKERGWFNGRLELVLARKA